MQRTTARSSGARRGTTGSASLGSRSRLMYAGLACSSDPPSRGLEGGGLVQAADVRTYLAVGERRGGEDRGERTRVRASTSVGVDHPGHVLGEHGAVIVDHEMHRGAHRVVERAVGQDRKST